MTRRDSLSSTLHRLLRIAASNVGCNGASVTHSRTMVPGTGQGAQILHIECGQGLVDFGCEVVVRKKLGKGCRRGGKAARHPYACGRKLANQFPSDEFLPPTVATSCLRSAESGRTWEAWDMGRANRKILFGPRMLHCGRTKIIAFALAQRAAPLRPGPQSRNPPNMPHRRSVFFVSDRTGITVEMLGNSS